MKDRMIRFLSAVKMPASDVMFKQFFVFLIIIVLFAVSSAFGQDSKPKEINPHDGPVKVKPDTSENIQSIPVDEKTGKVDWENYSYTPPGPGARFGFMSALFPPDPASLTGLPHQLLDTAWYPTIPFSYGYAPPVEGQVSVQGWWYLEDSSGNLARRDMTISVNGQSWGCSTWFLGCSNLFHIEEGWTEGYFSETNYMPDDYYGGGIDYFLRSVWFRGILDGEAMDSLLTACNAEHIGRDLMRGGRDRLAVFRIPPNEFDRQNGRGELLVWLTVGHWRIVRTRLQTVYATEVTEYKKPMPGIQNEPEVFYSEYLPKEVYTAVHDYLLTHNAPFWGPGTDQPPFNPYEAGLLPYDSSSTSSNE